MTRAAVVLVAGMLSACASEPPLTHTAASAEALAADIVQAVAQRDRARLESLALDEQEFRRHVWPELPASRPERNLPFSYVWGDLRQKSAAGLTQTLARHGGEGYEVVAVTFAGASHYGAYRVHRAPTIVVRGRSGDRGEIALTGSLLEKDGRWKVFSYVVDD